MSAWKLTLLPLPSPRFLPLTGQPARDDSQGMHTRPRRAHPRHVTSRSPSRVPLSLPVPSHKAQPNIPQRESPSWSRQISERLSKENPVLPLPSGTSGEGGMTPLLLPEEHPRPPQGSGVGVGPVRQPCGVFAGLPCCKNTLIRQESDLAKQGQPHPESVPAGPPPSRPLRFSLAGVSAAFVFAFAMEIVLCFAVLRASATAKMEVPMTRETARFVKTFRNGNSKRHFLRSADF